MKKNYYLILGITLFILLVSGYFVLSKKLTYLETAYLSHTSDESIAINQSGTIIEEHFKMPYDIINSVSIKISNNGEDSNSLWELSLITDSGQEIVSKRFGFYNAVDGEYYQIKFGKNILVDKGEFYRIVIKAIDIEEESKLAFYIGHTSNIHSESAELYVNGSMRQGNLCIVINGGEQDYFWYALYVFALLVFVFVGIRIIYLVEKGIVWYKDTLICSILVGIIVFLIYCPFANTAAGNVFIDENDNIRGGMIIANGGVLYRDYVTQHPPIGYYLCAMFALLGAVGVEQMRLLFYITLGIVWSLMFSRYQKVLGKKTMVIIPVMVILCSRALVGYQSTMILADTIQEMAMILLLLEFVYYYREPKLNLARCFIVSLSVWAALGSVFISIYSLFIFFLCFVIVEICEWKKKTIALKNFISRYFLLLVTCIIPPIFFWVYFKINHALYECFQQTYLFNREVYTQYQNIGDNMFEPFLSGLASVSNQYVSGIVAIGTGQTSVRNLLIIALVSGYIVYIITKVKENKKNIGFIFLLTLMITTGAARGEDSRFYFHSQACWGMLIAWLIIALRVERQRVPLGRGLKNILLASFLCIIFNSYISAVTENIAIEQETVSYTDTLILDLTKEGEKIFISASSNDSIYLLSKDRYPVNRAVYCLPWYMDWYESWNLADLEEAQPNIAIWNPDEEVWGIINYMPRLNNYILEHYTRVSEGSIIWVKT